MMANIFEYIRKLFVRIGNNPGEQGFLSSGRGVGNSLLLAVIFLALSGDDRAGTSGNPIFPVLAVFA